MDRYDAHLFARAEYMRATRAARRANRDYRHRVTRMAQLTGLRDAATYQWLKEIWRGELAKA